MWRSGNMNISVNGLDGAGENIGFQDPIRRFVLFALNIASNELM